MSGFVTGIIGSAHERPEVQHLRLVVSQGQELILDQEGWKVRRYLRFHYRHSLNVVFIWLWGEVEPKAQNTGAKACGNREQVCAYSSNQCMLNRQAERYVQVFDLITKGVLAQCVFLCVHSEVGR